ncbi:MULTISPECIES: hypothetical protein [Streptomyces]|uniref:hypothetical protein n=1 Tax=Streptomyces TaxID=1883 RepID=UPI000682782D|nr:MULTISPECIES: hypothetical protein [Streptomyces]MCX4489159.1 hypothetical protein [Streptomyces anulatus]MCX4503714.1 hypothetical protein [Streptomyces anulatus]WSU75759.1 hypothetical protein OG499_23720 [Streptomyces anulatus]WTD12140.1 hypothetical protein OHA54_24195 [Streptomyces anulatus]WTD25843.1 hypothetical protein OH737_15410 [Streptomyces anulatus]
MSRRPSLPPPPPPVEIRTWPDREAMLADRALILRALVGMHLGPGRLGVLVMWAGLAAFGWLLVGSGLVIFEQAADFFSGIAGILSLLLGAGALIPAVVLGSLYVARDREIRALLVGWGALDRDPEHDRELRLPGMSLVWLLLSFVLAAGGLALCVIGPASARPGDDSYGMVALIMGLGMVAWLTGLIGAVKALAHRRWVLRVLAAPAPPAAPAADAPAPADVPARR